jgi:hypothetical protein
MIQFQKTSFLYINKMNPKLTDSAGACSLGTILGVVTSLYLIFVHAISAFSPPLIYHGSSSRLQHSSYSPSVSVFSLSVSTTLSDLTISEFNS